jgi:ankyrin repeat protein
MIEHVLHRYSRHVEFFGEKLEEVSQVGVFGSQVIHLAAFSNRCDDIEELLQAGADIDAIGDLGLRPLHYAVLGGGLEAVRLLLNRGATACVENEFGETPAQMAYLMENTDIESLLLELSGQSASGFDGGTTAKKRWLEFKSIQQGNFCEASEAGSSRW